VWRYLKKGQPVTAAKFINKGSLFIPLPGVIRRMELSEQKIESLFVAPPSCQGLLCLRLCIKI